LKQATSAGNLELVRVAPLAGAWIETSKSFVNTARVSGVAPLAGAWIETFMPKYR